MTCYLCKGTRLSARKGVVRDNPTLHVLECQDCGLVQLDSFDHIRPGHYEGGNMHLDESLDAWVNGTAADDDRRFDTLSKILEGRDVLDFGSGTGGFLRRAQRLAKSVAGVEPEERASSLYADIPLYLSIEAIEEKRTFDIITAFHVVEHLTDPRAMLTALGRLLGPQGRMIVEVPSASDALLTLYDCEAFSRFTYWSQHLFLFTPDTLKIVIEQAGLSVAGVEQVQRYPLSNHLYWLSQHAPGGHQRWPFLNSPELQDAYAAALAAVGKCDTLVAQIER